MNTTPHTDVEEIVKEYRNLFSTGHSEMSKDELVFVPDKESKRGEDWLRTTLTSYGDQCRREGEEKTLSNMYENLPDYIDENFPKGQAIDRGDATVKICMFLIDYAKKEHLPLPKFTSPDTKVEDNEKRV